VISAGLLFLLASATSPVRVVDDGCPAGADVELALASMLTSSGVTSEKQDVAKVEHASDKLHVELRDPEGIVIAERTLDGGASCAELARMVAIVIASWESDVHPEFVRRPAEIARVQPAPLPEPPIPTAPAVVASYDVAAGATVGQADTLAAGASIGAAWFPRGVGLGAWILGAGDFSRTIAVGTHQASWRRWTTSLELAYRSTRDRLAFDAHAGMALGWVSTEGIDYDQNRSVSATSVGGTAGIRMSWWVSRHAALWGDVRAVYFPRPDSIYGSAAGTTVDQTAVPSWGGIASLGVALGRGPLSR
jgi:hypothetical protein